ncbi:hypothetical protein [Pradoshia sp.]
MKNKFWLGLMMAFALILVVGCSSSSEESSEKSSNDSEASKEDMKSDILDFYLSLANTINANDVALNTYELSEEPDKLTEEDKAAASESAKATGEALGEVKVPEGLSDYKNNLNVAIEAIQTSYSKKAEILAGDSSETMDDANESFSLGSEMINDIFDELGLSAVNLNAEVNS